MAPNYWQTKVHEIQQQGELPKHIAIIMDGNGRWATRRQKPRVWGHQQGAESVRCLVEAAGELGIEALTLYAFSEENWGRPETEVNGIMNLLGTYIVQEKDALHENNVRLTTIGCIEKLPTATRRLLADAEEHLAANTGLILNIALSYGAKTEITHACRELAAKVARQEIAWQEIDVEMLAAHLWTSGLRDPDLLIRTSGEQRLSNFLLWQMAYTELWFTPVHWPDFRREHFYEAISAYQKRKRRFGLVDEREGMAPLACSAELMPASTECRS